MFPNKVTIKGKIYMPKPVVEQPEEGKIFIILGDEKLKERNYQSRTADPKWTLFPCTPSVTRFYKDMIDQQGDFRVDITPLLLPYLRLNNESTMDSPKTRYLFAPETALFNQTGYPKQAYITMQGNQLKGDIIGNTWIKFETLTPQSNVAGMSHLSHPWFVHRFDLVCWDAQRKVTYHKPYHKTEAHGIIYYYLVTAEGFAYIPARYVWRLA